MRLSVVGCGYLGTTHAACMAELGFEVLGLETSPSKLALLSRGVPAFFEPGLHDLLQRHVQGGRLRFTDDAAEVADFADTHFLCVGTPQRHDSMGADLSEVDGAVEALAPHLTRPALVVGKSTVPVGTATRLASRLVEIAPAGDQVELAWNPEFLREGLAIADTLKPDRLVFGVTSDDAAARLCDIYAKPLADDTPLIITDYATAELVKVSANAFLATKISFINAVAQVCEVTGANVADVADAIGYDDRIGRRFLNAGIGFGGGCLPKDVRAFLHQAGELGVADVVSLLREVDTINLHRRQQAVQLATDMVGGHLTTARIAVLGAAFKPDSDDVRDSPALWIAGQLQLGGAHVTVYDPQAMASSAELFPTLDYAADATAACRGADLVMHLTEWPQFRHLTPYDLEEAVAHPRMLDGRNCLDADLWRGAGWEFQSMGRR
jgi:UDPglucose 6-dehydrogenase